MRDISNKEIAVGDRVVWARGGGYNLVVGTVKFVSANRVSVQADDPDAPFTVIADTQKELACLAK